MRRLIRYSAIFLICLLGSINSMKAQSYFGFQIIGSQTYFFSLSYDGQPHIGFGYMYRTFQRQSFNEWHAEVRFPVTEMYQWRNFTAIAGVYSPNRLRRTWIGMGAHFRYHHEHGIANKLNEIQLALTALPSYTYQASLSDGPYATVGARVTYLPTIYSSVNETSQWLSDVNALELGFHSDVLLERAAGMAANIYKPFGKNLKPEMKKKVGGDFYFGPNF